MRAGVGRFVRFDYELDELSVGSDSSHVERMLLVSLRHHKLAPFSVDRVWVFGLRGENSSASLASHSQMQFCRQSKQQATYCQSSGWLHWPQGGRAIVIVVSTHVESVSLPLFLAKVMSYEVLRLLSRNPSSSSFVLLLVRFTNPFTCSSKIEGTKHYLARLIENKVFTEIEGESDYRDITRQCCFG